MNFPGLTLDASPALLNHPSATADSVSCTLPFKGIFNACSDALPAASLFYHPHPEDFESGTDPTALLAVDGHADASYATRAPAKSSSMLKRRCPASDASAIVGAGPDCAVPASAKYFISAIISSRRRPGIRHSNPGYLVGAAAAERTVTPARRAAPGSNW